MLDQWFRLMRPCGSNASPREQEFYEEYARRFEDRPLERLRIALALVPRTAAKLLDVGCAHGFTLSRVREILPDAELHGIDVHASVEDELGRLGFIGESCDASREIRYPRDTFDAVICTEVLEHVVDTDNLLAEIYRVLKPGGSLILSTPNLAYAVNRLLLLCGVQPLYTETSLKANMGRRFRFLGQLRAPQGHLRIFTLGSVLDILAATGFAITTTRGYPFMEHGLPGVVDWLLALRPSLAAGLVLSATAVKEWEAA